MRLFVAMSIIAGLPSAASNQPIGDFSVRSPTDTAWSVTVGLFPRGLDRRLLDAGVVVLVVSDSMLSLSRGRFFVSLVFARTPDDWGLVASVFFRGLDAPWRLPDARVVFVIVVSDSLLSLSRCRFFVALVLFGRAVSTTPLFTEGKLSVLGGWGLEAASVDAVVVVAGRPGEFELLLTTPPPSMGVLLLPFLELDLDHILGVHFLGVGCGQFCVRHVLLDVVHDQLLEVYKKSHRGRRERNHIMLPSLTG